jgi:hypothetical protein
MSNVKALLDDRDDCLGVVHATQSQEDPGRDFLYNI